MRVLIRRPSTPSEATAVLARENAPRPVVLHSFEQGVRSAAHANVTGVSGADQQVDYRVDRNPALTRGDELSAAVAVLSRSVDRLLRSHEEATVSGPRISLPRRA
jgi:hypothetical protein